ARFIIKSLPLQEITAQKIEQGNKNDLLPTIIDYAAGSGHFLTESMEVVQQYIDKLELKGFKPETRKQIQSFQTVQFDWAEKYVYGIEKDYRLVKTAKVSCYLHGDGLAKVIHGDGLGDFTTSKEFKDLLKETDKIYPQDNKQFDVIISNPPYSVSAFKGLMDEEKAKVGFDLYSRLTDQSSEIECLFIERTKQLLKDGGVAGIILPSSILSNTGIYSQTREILFKHFEILGIAELGSNTFMATGTNTVTLFLRRRNNADAYNVEEAIKKCFVSLQDVTINGIEKPLAKYVAHVWDSISFEDYKTLLQKSPNKNIEQHEIYIEYTKKIKANERLSADRQKQELWTNILAIEQDKLLYFILAYPQKLVLIKTGEKNEEKRFLGYEFSNRRGSEGIHAIQRSKSIDECTQLYDADSFTNPEKASFYIYKAFLGEYDLDLPENLQQNLSYHNLVDMFTFDRVDFEKNISLSAKKKIVIDSKFDQEKVENVFVEIKNGKNVEQFDINGKYRVSRIETIADATFNINATKWTNDNVSENDFLQKGDILLSHINSVSHLGKTALFNLDEKVVHGVNLLRFRPNQKLVNPKYISEIFKVNVFISEMQKYAIKAANQASINAINIKNLKIPLPPLDIQQKIVSEIEALEKQEQKAVEEKDKLREVIISKIEITKTKNQVRLEEVFAYNTDTKDPRKLPEDRFIYVDIQSVGKDNGEIDYTQEILGKTAPSRARRLAKQGEFIISSVRPNLKGFAYLNDDVSKCIFSTGFFIVNTKNEHIVLNKFGFYLFMYSQDILNQMVTKMDKGQYPSVNSKDFDNIRIPLPTISEQKKIVTEIEKIETQIAELEKQIADIPKQKEKILKKYLE
ncbi:MAG: restriction endonuclease subunit S, partial [Flavobacteriaceae bacterium]|nr:restriction endonuclease subunit S [Flavobacteriaceae bacterium]